MSTNGSLSYSIDLVLCIDVTGSMRQTLQSVKDVALDFHRMIAEKLTLQQKIVNSLRVRVVAYRDLYADKPAFEVSEFFSLPDQAATLRDFVAPMKAKGGGGDGPESGLEALSIAMHSAWSNEADRFRHVIVLWTDAAPHPLDKEGEPAEQHGFESSIARDLDQLTDWWEDPQSGPMQHSGRRLILFAPPKGQWSDIAEHWSNTVHVHSAIGNGLRDFDLDEILDLISRTI